MNLLRKQSPARLIALGFLSVILVGSILLSLPIAHKDGESVQYIDALFTSFSAVCVTGLITVDTASVYSGFGHTVIALLIQIGGLGVMSVGVGFIMLFGGYVGFKERLLLKESINFGRMGGIVKLLRAILVMTLTFELTGTIVNFILLQKFYSPLKSLGLAAFHSISAFNNAGFDIFGVSGSQPAVEVVLSDPSLAISTSLLIICGGLGYYTLFDIWTTRNIKKFRLHTKIVLSMTATLLILGTLVIRLTEGLPWLDSFFNSVTARSAGFSATDMSTLSYSGLFFMTLLMFIGSSPGSTGGGIKTTTAFTVIFSTFRAVTNRRNSVFRRKIPGNIVTKAFMITFLAFALIMVSTFLLSFLEPQLGFQQVLFEVVSAFGTVGLSTGITSGLSGISKVVLMLTMFIGRLGPLTAATIWSYRREPSVSYSEEEISLG